jgi:hypothetical protein
MTLPTPDPYPADRWLDHLSGAESGYPLIRIDEDASWEVYLPPEPFDDTDLVNVTITTDGIYVENTDGDWDIIPFSELSELMQGAGCRNLDERIDLVDPRLSLIAKLDGTVKRCPGQPGYIVTGKQRAFEMFATADRSL